VFEFIKSKAEVDHNIGPEPYTKKNECEVVVLCGCPGAGKSSFYWQQLEPLGYERINQDILKTVR
jgi:bifunctional polynucleotide phosphatase/kinase